MTLFIALALCYLLGLSILLLISREYSLAELAGYSFLTGIGIETVFLFLLDVFQLQYSQAVLLFLNVLAIAVITGLNYKNLYSLKKEFVKPPVNFAGINYVAVFICCFIIWLFYTITAKNLFWPPTETDSITSFDKLGRIMAVEGKLRISLFQYHLEGAAGVYPPLFHGSFAYVYLFGAETPKIITTLFFISLLTTFFSAVKNSVGATAAMLFTFILILTPELFSHAALSLGNMPTAAYVCAGGLATITWLDKKQDKYFWVAAILMAFTVWIRSDTIAFTLVALILLAFDARKTKRLKYIIIYSAFSLLPFIIWALYVRFAIGSTLGNRFNFSGAFNTARLSLMLNYLKAFLFGFSYGNINGGLLYGISFVIFFVMLALNLIMAAISRNRQILLDKKYVLIFLFGSLFIYFIEFYLIDEKVQSAPISSLMESSFKRGLFCFLPLALFYTATNSTAKRLFEKLEKYRSAA